MSAMKIKSGALPFNKNQGESIDSRKLKLEQKMQGAAKLYERQFLNQMVKAMRSTVQHSEFSKPSMAEQIYLDKMYDKYVDKWTEGGGVGFGNIIYEQLLEKYSPYHRNKLLKPQGPIEFKKEQKQMFKIDKPEKFKDLDKVNVSLKTEGGTSKANVIAPWDGQVVRKVKNEEGRVWLQMDHGEGLRSDISYIGDIDTGLTEGQAVFAGSQLGRLGSEENQLNWSIVTQPKS